MMLTQLRWRRLNAVFCALSVETDWEGLVHVGFWDYLVPTQEENPSSDCDLNQVKV